MSLAYAITNAKTSLELGENRTANPGRPRSREGNYHVATMESAFNSFNGTIKSIKVSIEPVFMSLIFPGFMVYK